VNIHTWSLMPIGLSLEDVWDDRGELETMTAFEESKAEPEEPQDCSNG
jgi:hypothetical protein